MHKSWSWLVFGPLPIKDWRFFREKCENRIFHITFSFQMLSSICFQIWINLFQSIITILVRSRVFSSLKRLSGHRMLQKGGYIILFLPFLSNFFWKMQSVKKVTLWMYTRFQANIFITSGLTSIWIFEWAFLYMLNRLHASNVFSNSFPNNQLKL